MLKKFLTPSQTRGIRAAASALFMVATVLGNSALAQRRQRFSGDMQPSCQLQSGGESAVVAVAGPQTLHLADGRFVRLAEVLVPAVLTPGTGFDPSSAAIAYLRSATLGRKVEVKYGGMQRDRYGVQIAHIFIAGEPPVWLQEGLVSSGFALAFPQVDNHACSVQLKSFEAGAREAKRGHWGLAFFKVLRAGDPRSIQNLVQTYQIVEGKAVHATESGGRVTIRFSEDNKYGFAAILEPAAKKRLPDKQEAEDWAGTSLRIRGWVERKRGPAISITQAEQIEFLPQTSEQTPDIKKAQ